MVNTKSETTGQKPINNQDRFAYYKLGEKDKSKYSKIGESDRMTLKFIK